MRDSTRGFGGGGGFGLGGGGGASLLPNGDIGLGYGSGMGGGAGYGWKDDDGDHNHETNGSWNSGWSGHMKPGTGPFPIYGPPESDIDSQSDSSTSPVVSIRPEPRVVSPQPKRPPGSVFSILEL